ncbi:hypothetical protein GS597_07230 [Synechococcales cyanobacterium C]|uniref:Uncharacterized protein n=1 Tax=Petrachloros mirabilis ULC683 TaxID=2781853 RepID=A0A8K1ZZ19_9CYAN|nr:hypothetical protein [Petrachloros mirabilis ULC683]
MLKTIQGIYQDGKIQLTELPQDVSDRSQVLVTFVDPDVSSRTYPPSPPSPLSQHWERGNRAQIQGFSPSPNIGRGVGVRANESCRTHVDPDKIDPVKLRQLIDRLETIEGIQQGFEELKSGQTHPIGDFVQVFIGRTRTNWD